MHKGNALLMGKLQMLPYTKIGQTVNFHNPPMWREHNSERSEESVLEDRLRWERKKLGTYRMWWTIFTLRCLKSFYGYSKDPFPRNINIEGIHKGTNWPYIKMIIVMIIIMKTTGSIYRRIYKMPATWTSYPADTVTNPHSFTMKALPAYFH